MIGNYFKQHFFIEMYYNRKAEFGFITEQTLNNTEKTTLFESYGVFNGCEELAEEIFEKVIQNANNNKYYFTFNPKNNCGFVYEINIKISNSGGSAFIPMSSEIDDFGYNRFYYRPLSLRIGIGENRETVIFASIMHELLHAYENYQRKINNKPSIDKIASDTGYYKNPVEKAFQMYGLKQKVSFILYHLTNFERNAFIASIKALSKKAGKFENIKQALEYIKNTVYYRNYVKIFEWGNDLLSINDEKTQDEILWYVKILSNYNFKTYNSFKKWLSYKIDKYQKKFNSIVPKIAAENFVYEETLNPSINKLIR